MRFLISSCTIHIFFILFLSSVYAQTIEVEYLVSEQSENTIFNKKTRYYLKIKNNQSIFYNKMDDSISQFVYKDQITQTTTENGKLRVFFGDMQSIYAIQRFYFKDYKKDTLLYIASDHKKKQDIVIAENFSIFKWQVKPDKDTTILSYPCKTATMNFRGRKYIAYFAPTLCPYGGPWKFDGLPGLILFIQSIDDYFRLEATKISLNTVTENIENPFKNVPTTDVWNWEKYIKNYREHLENFIKKARAMSEDGEAFTIKLGGIEDLGIGELTTKGKGKKDKKK